MSLVRVEWDFDRRVAVVWICRPSVRNAVDRPTAEELAEAVIAVESEDRVSVGILTGEGGYFCAGADLKALGSGDVNRVNRMNTGGDGPMGPSRFVTDKVWIAAIEGFAVAGGLELACWCDLRVVAQDATMGVFCRRFGVPLIDGGTVRLPKLIGMSHALDLIITGRPVSAAEAQGMGLANRVAPPGQALDVAMQLATEIAQLPQLCLQNDRRSVYDLWDAQSTEAAMKREFELGLDSLAESKAGAQRFLRGAGRHGKTVTRPKL